MSHKLMPAVFGGDTSTIALNNAATTPPFVETLKILKVFLKTYGAFHRGAGPNANTTYQATIKAIKTIGVFLGIREDQSLLFTHNTSAAINLFARLLKLKKGDVIITSIIEHTSNHLPWKFNTPATVVYVNSFSDGALDFKDLKRKTREHSSNLKLIAITGASNLTGYMPDLKKIAVLAHNQEALLFVDAAQLVPHRPINMKELGIDALAFSAHKLYAPFGLGVLALPKSILEIDPVDPGGGSIDMINENDLLWAPAEARHQTGTWNVAGIVATAASCKILETTGWNNIIAHERSLTRYAVKRLSQIPGVTLYVPPTNYVSEERIGTIAFNLAGVHHALLSAILENEYGVETRAGTICNHRLVRRWLKVDAHEQKQIEKKMRSGNRLASYGIVRASIGIQNTKKDIDALVKALIKISKNGPKLPYEAVPKEETYICKRRT